MPLADRPDRTALPGGLDRPLRWIVENPGTVDKIVFGSLTGVLALGIVPAIITGGGGWLLFTVPMVAAGMFLRTRTGWATFAVGLLAVTHWALLGPVILGDVMIFYALYMATAHGSRWTGRLAMTAAFVGCAMQAGLLALTNRASFTTPEQWVMTAIAFVVYMLLGSAVVLGVWALGRYQRVRVGQLRLAQERAEQAVREREQRTALAVAGERARIAREMHDVVAHSLSVIIAQADGGRFIAAQHPEKAVDVLTTISTTGRTALADMRSLLGVLRQEESTAFGPQPGPERLDDLIAQVRATGLEVALERTGSLDGLSQSLGMSLFRLVQESLTNVLKHGGEGASAVVRITRDARRLEVEVVDDGQGIDPSSDGQGHGLTGMRERVALFGGTLQAGPLPGHGFRVLADFPLASEPAPGAPSPAAAPPAPAPHASAPRPEGTPR